MTQHTFQFDLKKDFVSFSENAWMWVSLSACVYILLCAPCDSSKTRDYVIWQRSVLQAESLKLRGIACI